MKIDSIKIGNYDENTRNESIITNGLYLSLNVLYCNSSVEIAKDFAGDFNE